ncbi:hypothetical protein QA640_42665 [Bradyrhizobium sp. CB82]|uniref:hypothetical protein n=1 Tax=Bradyrhizobium sp. CB82 TaxID=3039159 RepID=UPI0024B22078|nr:hypothetical protein [Bradyrhizobium sp. CB82]WFU40787.1 hypothetical protein QA640_42665 [Bradyrhizobium sp. CB82]
MPLPLVTISLQHPAIGHITGRVTHEDTKRTLTFESRDVITTLHSYADAIRLKVERYMARIGNQNDELRGAANLGWLFLDSLLGKVWDAAGGQPDPAFKAEALAWLSAKGGMVVIDSEYLHAPWNFLHLIKPGASANVSDFLGARQLVLQRVNLSGGLPPVWPVRRMFAIHGNDKPMIAEMDGIESRASGNAVALQRFPKDMNTVIAHCPTEFDALWMTMDPSVIHVASHLIPPLSVHGRPGPDWSAAIQVANDVCSEKLEVGDVLANVQSSRAAMELGFFNLCSLGKGTMLLHAGVAAAFAVRVGCSIFVDMLLHSDLAEKFASAFYAAYLTGEDPIKAYGKAKQAVSVSDEETVRALCYRFTFGDHIMDMAA